MGRLRLRFADGQAWSHRLEHPESPILNFARCGLPRLQNSRAPFFMLEQMPLSWEHYRERMHLTTGITSAVGTKIEVPKTVPGINSLSIFQQKEPLQEKRGTKRTRHKHIMHLSEEAVGVPLEGHSGLE